MRFEGCQSRILGPEILDYFAILKSWDYDYIILTISGSKIAWKLLINCTGNSIISTYRFRVITLLYDYFMMPPVAPTSVEPEHAFSAEDICSTSKL